MVVPPPSKMELWTHNICWNSIRYFVVGAGGRVVLPPIFVHFTECIDIVEGTKINHNISSQIKIMPSIYSI